MITIMPPQGRRRLTYREVLLRVNPIEIPLLSSNRAINSVELVLS
jgi:hypothetical protein